MARSRPARKQRTRQHILADQSVNYVERFIIDEGHTVQRIERDYGYDLFLWTFDDQGYAEAGVIFLQLEAAEHLQESGTDYVFDLDVRDYNLWRMETNPVILVLYDGTRRKAYWLYVQQYFLEDESRRPGRGRKTVRVRVPRRHAFTCRGVERMRRHKQEVIGHEQGNR